MPFRPWDPVPGSKDIQYSIARPGSPQTKNHGTALLRTPKGAKNRKKTAAIKLAAVFWFVVLRGKRPLERINPYAHPPWGGSFWLLPHTSLRTGVHAQGVRVGVLWSGTCPPQSRICKGSLPFGHDPLRLLAAHRRTLGVCN